MFNKLKDLLHIGSKVVDGSIGDGVSRKQSETMKAKGKSLESDIERVLIQCGYKVVKNVYVPFQSKKGYTEIDLVAINQGGILIVESKNYNAKIIAEITDKNWTTLYRNGKTYSMYSPVLQNEGHMKHLARYFNLENTMAVRSLIVFSPNAELALKGMSRLSNNVAICRLQDIPQVVKGFRAVFNRRTINQYVKEIEKLANASSYVKIKQRRTANKYKG